MGCPCSICDGDITAKLPSEMDGSLSALNMSLHVRLSRLMARILTAIYGVGKQFDGSLAPNTQKVLRELAQLSKDINELLNTHFQGSISKALGPISDHHIVSLLQSCVDSAMIILRTLRGMGDEDLLEAFLPFQLEDASSSAFILYLIRTINPSLLTDERWSEDVKHVLDKMIAKGSVAAPLRKRELGQLEDALVAVSPVCDEPTTPSVGQQEHQAAIASTVRPADSGWDLFLENGIVGISPTEMLDLAAQLEVDNDFGPQVMDW
ncbi:putative fungal specific transcription factor [Diplodia seriata]|uniref:Putative fungal specific transcription factor n=1 Tax=Diplodia seriata TaxID=420778 RepID=A0A0G2DXN4_9PEZI|nr:putative fungal specific transcription factor [Diplodia seriata]